MELKEFTRFGFFRAGHRLQLKNLLSSLEERNLSFNQLGVYSLIAQSLWELGPIDYLKPLLSKKYPDSHADFSNQEYAENLAQVLFNFASLIEKKWNDHLILLNLITILNRAISMLSWNEPLLNRMVDCLRKCRRIGCEWQAEIEKLIEKSRADLKDTELENLKAKLLEICCFTILTYNVEKANAHLVMSSNEDVIVWLSSMSKITSFNSLFGAISSENNFLVNLIRRTEICMLHVEDEYYRVVEVNKKIPLLEYIKKIWAESSKGKFGPFNSYDKHWHQVEFEVEFEKINLFLRISGEFLVDGLPVGRLPKQILQHDLYASYFGGFNFKVHPSILGKGVFVTSDESKSSFTFVLIEQDLLIYESRRRDVDCDEKLLLIPKNVFTKDFPHFFVNDFSHWLNQTKMTIEFRPSSYHQKNYAETNFVFDLVSMKLCDQSDGKHLVDMSSETFKEINKKITSRLELEKYVHIFLSSNRTVSIELKRLGLNFELDMSKNQVLSKEYSGMIVSPTQELNTLIGLNKGLVLCKKNSTKYNKKNQFIVPHGKIEYNQKLNRMDINLEKVSEPTFFSYEIDNRLKRLKAGESLSAWLYLACLHGYTAQILPDPFTSLTGTEMALEILESGYCWSCKSLSEIETSILNKISGLSPQRAFYPKHERVMQSVDWPIGVPSLAAHEAFAFIAEKIQQDSKRISFAYGETHPKMMKAERKDTFLKSRAYNRNKNSLTVSCLLDSNFESCIPVGEDKEFNYVFNLGSGKIKNMRIVSSDNYLDYLNKSDFRLDLVKFICNECSLKGFSDVDFFEYSIGDLITVSKDLKNNWIDLYNFSKNAKAKKEKDHLKFILAILCYKGVDIRDLLIFRLISDNFQLFLDLNPPKYSEYQRLGDFKYDKTIINNILNQKFISFESFAAKENWDIKRDYYTYQTKYISIKNAQI